MFYINNHDDDDDNNNNNNNNFQWTNQLRAPSYHKVQSQEYEILEDNPASQPRSRGSISPRQKEFKRGILFKEILHHLCFSVLPLLPLA